MTRSALASLLFVALGIAAHAEDDDRLSGWWTPDAAQRQRALEAALDETPSTENLRRLHDLFSSRPHPAGTPGDEAMITALLAEFEALGLKTERHRFWAYLPEAVSARLEIVGGMELAGPTDLGGKGPTKTESGSLRLSLKEDVLEEDPYTKDPRLTFGWNAYSGSGVATGEVIYANYGTLDDFRELERRGHDVKGKIVIARYGKNYRGYKAKFAERFGAAGLIMYTDPADSGSGRGATYPDGGWANGSYIQRGSVKTLPYAGDPLTPGKEATRDAERLDPATLDLPRIPVQPIGYRAAAEILARMEGAKAPDGWQGGLPGDYRIEGGENLRVELEVRQRRRIIESSNVLARIEGARRPEQIVIIGCHHDAWTFGAGDPQSGTILVYEVARSFARAAAAGHRPDRTIVFANWGAEEYGIIGSTEWCEGNARELGRNAVAYINLDMATMGPDFRSSSAPALQAIIADATRAVPHSSGERTVYEDWCERQEIAPGETPRFGNLGGGSDHIGLYCHLGIPCASIGAGGSAGVSYHSNYETLAWYRKIVGDDYSDARMLTRVVNVVAARLATASVVPIDATAHGRHTRHHLEDLAERAGERWPQAAAAELYNAIALYELTARNVQRSLAAELARGKISDARRRKIDDELLGLERHWLSSKGLEGRPWFRNLYAASDPDSGYAAWMLPAVRQAVDKDGAIDGELRRCRRVFDRLTAAMLRIDRILAGTGQN